MREFVFVYLGYRDVVLNVRVLSKRYKELVDSDQTWSVFLFHCFHLSSSSSSLSVFKDILTFQLDSSSSSDFSSFSLVVLKFGSCESMVGFTRGEMVPRSVFPSCIINENRFVGYEALSFAGKRGVKEKLTWPVQKGRIVLRQKFGELIHHSFFKELRVDPSESCVVFVDSVITTDEERCFIADLLFDVFFVCGIYFIDEAQGIMLSEGRSNAMVVLIGDEHTIVVPVVFGHTLKYALVYSNHGSR